MARHFDMSDVTVDWSDLESTRNYYRVYQQRWRATDAGKASRRVSASKWAKTPKGRECQANMRRKLKVEREDQRLRRVYGISMEQRAEMFTAIEGKCPICGKLMEFGRAGYGNSVHVDHDHQSGSVRGLLCGSCNIHLGWLEKVGVDAIMAYLRKEELWIR